MKTFGEPLVLNVDWGGVEKAQSDFDASIKATAEQRANEINVLKTSNLPMAQVSNRLDNLTIAGSAIGTVLAIGYAVYKKTGFWKGAGYGLLGSFTGGTLFRGVAFLTTKNK